MANIDRTWMANWMVPRPLWLCGSIQNKLMICMNLPCKWIALPGDRTTQRWNYLSERICFLHKICKCDRKITLGTIIWMRVYKQFLFYRTMSHTTYLSSQLWNDLFIVKLIPIILGRTKNYKLSQACIEIPTLGGSLVLELHQNFFKEIPRCIVTTLHRNPH